MMGDSQKQNDLFHAVQLEDLVPEDHPLRRIRPLVDTERIRELCKGTYSSDNGRPSIPPEQSFLALLGGCLLGCGSDRRIIMELRCNMAFRWFAGLDIDSKVWEPSTFSKNREHRFDDADIFEKLFDDTVKAAIAKGWVSPHWSADGTVVRADASLKSFIPIEVRQRPEDFRQTIRGKKKEGEKKEDGDDKVNPSVNWRGEKRSNQTHQSGTDPDARLATKSNREGAQPGYTVNGIMEKRTRGFRQGFHPGAARAHDRAPYRSRSRAG